MARLGIVVDATNNASRVLRAVNADLGGLQKTARGVNRALGGVRDGLGRGLKLAAGAGAAGLGLLTLAFRDSVGLAREQINVEKQLEAVIQSTGGAAGLSADEIKRMASSLQTVTNFGDEAIISGQNLLLTFTNIGRDVFPDATEMMLDMSQALGQDLKSSAIQLGKALNDPVAGITALTRVGVSFTEQQKEQIKAMVEMGDVAGAQRLILAELGREFGGSARAMADPAVQLQNAWGDLKEELGKGAIPVINDLAQRAMPLVQGAIERVSSAVPFATDAIGELWSHLVTLNFDKFDTTDNIYEFVNALTGSSDAAAMVANAVQSMSQAIEWGRDRASELGAVIQTVAGPIIEFVQANVEAQDVLTGLGVAIAVVVVPALASLAAGAAPVVGAFALVIGASALLRSAWETDWGGIQEKTRATIDFVQSIVQRFTSLSTQWWSAHGQAVVTIVTTLWDMVSGLFQGGGESVSGILETLGAYWNRTLGRTFALMGELVEAFAALLTGDWDALGEHLLNAWNLLWAQVGDALGTAAGLLVRGVQALIRTITGTFTGETDWGELGRAMVRGIVAGASALGGMLADMARSLAGSFLSSFKRAMGIGSPSRVMAEMGTFVVQGLTQGIMRESQEPVLALAGVGAALPAAVQTSVTNNTSSTRNEVSISVVVQAGPGSDSAAVAQAAEDGTLNALREAGLA